MPQRYKVRLGDGTFMSVDLDGLRGWSHDGAALAQAVGSQQWRPLNDVLTEEENAARLMRALIPPQPKAAAPEPPPPPLEPAPLPVPAFEPPVQDAPAFGQPRAFGEPAFGAPAPFGESAFIDPPAAAPQQDLQAPADAGSPDDSGPPMPPIRMKPLEDDGFRSDGFRSAWDEGEEGHEADRDEPPEDPSKGPLVTLLAPLGAFLSRVLAPLTSLLERMSKRRPAITDSSFPSIIEPEPLALEEEIARPSLGERLSASWSGLLARFRRPESEAAVEEDEPEPEAEPEPEVEAPRPLRAPQPPRVSSPREPVLARAAAPREAVAPPPRISELKVVPLAEPVEQRPVERIYADEEPSELVATLWFWTKRVAVLGALAAAGYYGYHARETWFPKAADLGSSLFNAIDRTAHSRERREQLQQALAAATPRLPHLTPQTILAAFQQSPTGVLEAPDVFQLTREAALRGADKLAPADAQELQALELELASGLSPPERRRLDEYDQARTRRMIFSFENPYAMDLVAKGARTLPPEKLERLRGLMQQAVAAGLAAAPAEPSADAPR